MSGKKRTTINAALRATLKRGSVTAHDPLAAIAGLINDFAEGRLKINVTEEGGDFRTMSITAKRRRPK